MTGCIFCGRSESNSQDLFVCSSCLCRFAGCSRETLEKAVAKHDLTEEQLHFLGLSKYSKSSTPVITKIKKRKK